MSATCLELTPSSTIAEIGVPSPSPKSRTRKRNWSRRTNSLMGVRVVGSGSYLPEDRISNEHLQAERGFDPDWIAQRTGIFERRYAAADEATSDLCTEAARAAMQDAQVDAPEVDLLVVGTFTPDYACPSTACLVQEQLGIDAPAFDVAAACSGFMYALVTAAQYVATGNSDLALVIGGDCNSRIVDPTDCTTAPLFGDGAGAVLLARGENDQGLLCYQMGSDGSGASLLKRQAGGSKQVAPSAGQQFLQMDGRRVFKWAVGALTESIGLVLEKSGMAADEVDLYVMHQANVRILKAAIEQLGLPPEKVVVNLHKYGNTSAGSIPIALHEACAAGRVQSGDTILLSGFGAGLTWGTGLFRW